MRLFKILSVFSLLLCAGTLLLWVRSYFVRDEFYRWDLFDHENQHIYWTQDYFQLGRGGVGFSRIVQSSPDIRDFRQDIIDARIRDNRVAPPFHRTVSPAYPNPPSDDRVPALGFRFAHWAQGQAGTRPRSEAFLVILPLWVPFVVTAILPGGWWYSIYRGGMRVKRGHCVRCGYDLRATPDRCPECGTPAVSEVTQPPALS
jgi:hypothetical protein